MNSRIIIFCLIVAIDLIVTFSAHAKEFNVNVVNLDPKKRAEVFAKAIKEGDGYEIVSAMYDIPIDEAKKVEYASSIKAGYDSWGKEKGFPIYYALENFPSIKLPVELDDNKLPDDVNEAYIIYNKSTNDYKIIYSDKSEDIRINQIMENYKQQLYEPNTVLINYNRRPNTNRYLNVYYYIEAMGKNIRIKVQFIPASKNWGFGEIDTE